ncbi:MAG: hypothetical protein EPO06_12080 [Burkholderiaceae bacterium]|nr:MAG: hypothetical protein EPO06_12080 [Burkholderiaceae bacterium]
MQRQYDPVVLTAYDELVLAEPTLVAYWPLGGSGADATGNGHTAVAHGSPTTLVGEFENGDNCTHFNGDGDYYEVAHHSALSPATTGVLCFGFWYRNTVFDFTNEEPNTKSPSGIAPYTYILGMNEEGPGHSEFFARQYSRHEGVDWLAQYGFTPARPNRTSGYVNNLAPIPPATVNLGAGSYYQDPVVLGEWNYYFFIINCRDTSGLYPQGYTEIFKNGVFRNINNNAAYNITPTEGDAALRFATAALTGAFWEGDLCKVEMHNDLVSPSRIKAHYLAVRPSPPGTATLTELGIASRSTAGTKLRYTLPRAVTPGSRIVIFAAHTYTAGNPTILDSGLNSYEVLRAASDGDLTNVPPIPHTIRGTWLSGQADAALDVGDQIELTTGSSTDECVMKVFVATGIDSITVLDASNSGQSLAGQSPNKTPNPSITPGLNTGITNTVPNVLLIGSNVVVGVIADGYTEDNTQPWTSHTRAASTGPIGLVLNSADQPVNDVSSNRKYRPTLGLPRMWLSFMLALRAGPVDVNPPVTGNGFLIDECGSAVADGAAATLPVPYSGDGIPAGHTVIGWLSGGYRGADAVVTDTAGNTWHVDRSGADPAHTLRGNIVRSVLDNDISPGDQFLVSYGGSVANRQAGFGEFGGLLVPTDIDVVNGHSDTSATPSVTATTVNDNDLLVAVTMAMRPGSDTPTPDITFRPLTAIGGANASTYPAYRSVGAHGPYTYSPALAAPAVAISLIAAYKAG